MKHLIVLLLVVGCATWEEPELTDISAAFDSIEASLEDTAWVTQCVIPKIQYVALCNVDSMISLDNRVDSSWNYRIKNGRIELFSDWGCWGIIITKNIPTKAIKGGNVATKSKYYNESKFVAEDSVGVVKCLQYNEAVRRRNEHIKFQEWKRQMIEEFDNVKCY